MIKIFSQSLEVLKKIKPIVIIVFVITLITLGAGFFMSQSDLDIVSSLKVNLMLQIEKTDAIQNIVQAIQSKNIIYAIFYTTGYNSFLGAFLSTTLVGVFFPLPLLVMVERAFFIGLLYGDIGGNCWYYLLLFGTILLEFGAYILSAAAGTNIGVSLFWPEKYKTKNRWKAFKYAWIDALKLYPLIVVILFVSAIWEIGGLYLLTR